MYIIFSFPCAHTRSRVRVSEIDPRGGSVGLGKTDQRIRAAPLVPRRGGGYGRASRR